MKPHHPTEPLHLQQLLKTLAFASGFVLIPIAIGVGLVALHTLITAPSRRAPITPPELVRQLSDATLTDLETLQTIRRDARDHGLNTEELDIRIWAALLNHPIPLIEIRPPDTRTPWTWRLSSDGAYAVALATSADTIGRRNVGLYDLGKRDWVWTNQIPWPDNHEAPHVVNKTLLLRYLKNGKAFAMEITPDGTIAAIDPVSRPPICTNPSGNKTDFPGLSIGEKSGLSFVAQTNGTYSLKGFATHRLPGIYPAGQGDPDTQFSGNGRLKFQIGNGCVIVQDSMTQTVLQRFAAWIPSTNTVVTSSLVTQDGGLLTVFLKTRFPGTPSVVREWTVSINIYSGTLHPSYSADILLAKPVPERNPLVARSRDERYQFTIINGHELVIAPVSEPGHAIARIPLSQTLGSTQPIQQLRMLEEGSHLLLRQGANCWLLDTSVMRNTASLLTRLQAVQEAAQTPPVTTTEPAMTEAPPPPAATQDASTIRDLAESTPVPPIAPLALQAEQLWQHQCWFYAAKSFEACTRMGETDSRAPRINPLLHVRACDLSGQRRQAKNICRNALNLLISDSTEYNRMMRYHLQGFLFSAP